MNEAQFHAFVAKAVADAIPDLNKVVTVAVNNFE